MLDTVHSTARWIGAQQNKAVHNSLFAAIDAQTANEQTRLEQLQNTPNTLFPAPVPRPKAVLFVLPFPFTFFHIPNSEWHAITITNNTEKAAQISR